MSHSKKVHDFFYKETMKRKYTRNVLALSVIYLFTLASAYAYKTTYNFSVLGEVWWYLSLVMAIVSTLGFFLLMIGFKKTPAVIIFISGCVLPGAIQFLTYPFSFPVSDTHYFLGLGLVPILSLLELVWSFFVIATGMKEFFLRITSYIYGVPIFILLFLATINEESRHLFWAATLLVGPFAGYGIILEFYRMKVVLSGRGDSLFPK